jgi:MFS family permease
VVFCYGLMNIGYGFARPGFTAGASLAVDANEQGAVAGALTAVVGAAFIASPVLGVALYEVWGPAPFLMNAALCLGLLAYALANDALKHAKAGLEHHPALEH